MVSMQTAQRVNTKKYFQTSVNFKPRIFIFLWDLASLITCEPSNIRNFNVRVSTAELSLSNLWSVMSKLNYRPELAVMRLKLFCLDMTCRTDAMTL